MKLTEHLKSLSASHQQLQKETANLVTALRKPQVRGRWGEMTLRRVVELSGMSPHCDFAEQVVAATVDNKQRPDLVVRLPSDREIVVDAKVPEFVVMFIPGESSFGAAVDADRSLIEDGLEKRVVLATPTTLIALLRAVAYGWRQEQIARNTQEISDLGKQLYERMRILVEHMAEIGKGLVKANTAYNHAIGSIEARVLPAARHFRNLGSGSGREIQVVPPVETTPRELIAPEFTEDKAPADFED